MVLVGAGPGDPELVTLRAEAELAGAAVVVGDAGLRRLVERFAPRAEVVLVANGLPAAPALLAARARSGGRVVRLYAGDPWLHPAHGAERAALQRAGVATDAVAGVAVEVAVPAQAGIAVHVRHLAVACTLAPEEAAPTPADPARTLVISCDDGAAAARRLVATGAADLPAALLPTGGGPDATFGRLSELPAAGEAGPCLLVVGAVADPHPDPAGRRPGPVGPR